MRYSFYSSGQKCNGSYSLSPLPGSTQVAVSHDVFLKKEFRGLGLSVPFAKERFKTAEELCFDLLICTCVETNIPQIKTLVKMGWVKVTVFTSSKTDNEVGVWIKHIKESK